MPDSTDPAHDPLLDGELRPHTFDGIQEYDKRLPRWWLITLYGAMIFAVLYWAYYEAYGIGTSAALALESEMAENAERALKNSGIIDDSVLYKMSLDPQVLAAGKVTFDTTCAACHKPDMTGIIGPNLVDNQWIHGGKPMDSIKVITEGVLAKGMPPWGPVLGKRKIVEVTAYIFSTHKADEEIVIVPGWTPPGGTPPAPTP